MNESVGFIVSVISLIMVITFFVMAFRLKKIQHYLQFFYEIESNKPENQKKVKCDKCEKEFTVSIAKKGIFNCPHCMNVIRL